MAHENHFIRPDMKAFLDMLAAVGSPSITTLALDDARTGFKTLHAMADRPSRDLPVIRDLACPGPAGEIPLRFYDAREARKASPVIMFFHGGGYVIGDLDTHNALCTEIAAQMDLPVVAVDYRRAPEHVFPAAVEDCEAAARWVASNPAELQRDVTGLITMGDSAGGNATIVVGQQMADNPAAVPVVLQVPIYPLASPAAGSASHDAFADGYMLTQAAIEHFDMLYAPDHNDRMAMPILGDHATAPPSIVVTASLDPIRDSGRDYAAALAQAGISHIHLEIQGVTHSFVNLRQAVPSTQGDLERIFAAMKFMLGEQA